MEQFKQLLEYLYRGGDTGYYWLESTPNVKGTTRKETRWFAVDTLPDVQQTGRYEHYHVFFSVNPTNGIPERMKDGKRVEPRHHRARLTEIVAVNCLFSDIDDTTARLDVLPVPPSVIIESSPSKYHCYWLLKNTHHITSDKERARIRNIQFAWCTALGVADDGAKDLTRVLRVPGTRNVKLKYRPDYPVVQIVKADFDLLYDLDELLPHCQHCIPEQRVTIRRKPTPPTDPDLYATSAWQGLLAEMSGATNGNRNTTLFKTARRAAEFVAAGRLPDSTIDDLGALARGKGLPDSEVVATLASARDGAVACYEGLPNRSEVRNKPKANLPPLGDGDDERANGSVSIDITDEHLGRITDAIWAAVQANCISERLYRYGTALAHYPPDGVFETLDETRWRGLINRTVSFQKTFKGKNGEYTREVIPPLSMVRDSMRFVDPSVRVIERIVHLPVFDRTGTLVPHGYHPESRLLNTSTITPEPMLYQDALDLLIELFCDFPFADSSSFANTLAYLLLPFVREMVGATPLHLIDASQRGTGKGLLNDLIHTIWHGEGATAGDLPLNAEEQRKAITTTLLRNPMSVTFDDVGYLSGHAIQRALTATTWTDRQLGANKDITVPACCVWAATGNNVTLGGDMVRRVVLIRLESAEEVPSQRTGFNRSEREIRQWVRKERVRFVGACIALVRHGLEHGKPDPPLKMGGFDEYVTVLSTILDGCGVQGFCITHRRSMTARTPARAGGASWCRSGGRDGRVTVCVYAILCYS